MSGGNFVYLTRERLIELEKELQEMKSTGRKEIASKIAEARAHGGVAGRRPAAPRAPVSRLPARRRRRPAHARQPVPHHAGPAGRALALVPAPARRLRRLPRHGAGFQMKGARKA